jgi:bifunctional non-homologous end joining protein LigD
VTSLAAISIAVVRVRDHQVARESVASRLDDLHRKSWMVARGGRPLPCLLAYKAGERVRLLSRTSRDHAGTFPAITPAVAALPRDTLILDGEVCAFDANLVSHVHILHPEPGVLATPPTFVAFDCVLLDGRDLRRQPLRERRFVLEGVVADSELIFPARRLAADGFEAWREVNERGYEGLVAKPASSSYRPGAWRKVTVRHEGVFELAGVARDRDGLLMLVVGMRDGRELRYAGTVSFGVTRRVVAEINHVIESLVRRTSPLRERLRFADCVWLAPRLRAELTYSEEGQRSRGASNGMSSDSSPWRILGHACGVGQRRGCPLERSALVESVALGLGANARAPATALPSSVPISLISLGTTRTRARHRGLPDAGKPRPSGMTDYTWPIAVGAMLLVVFIYDRCRKRGR